MKKSRIEELVIYSKSLNKPMPVVIYLPSGYDDEESLPVLYFLHGRSGDENFIKNIELDKVADRLIENEDIKPMIIVCPRIENSRGINSSPICKDVKDPYGRTINLGMYEDYFMTDIIPYIDKNFKTVKNRLGRFIGGVSAGGYAALHNALRHPDLFSKVGGHMPALELQLEDEDKQYFQNPENWNKYDPIYIAKNMEYSDTKIYLDAGDNDEGEFYKGCSVLYKNLKVKGFEVENHIFQGHHNLEYIKSNMEKYLMFYGTDNITS